MTRYVLGFIFTENMSHVLLIYKLHGPVKDRLNGVGGKIESDETPHMAMAREALEETCLENTVWKTLTPIGDNRGWKVDTFYTKVPDILRFTSGTDEPCMIFPTSTVLYHSKEKTLPIDEYVAPLIMEALKKEGR